MVPLKYPSNFWRTLEMHLINCETNVILSWSEKRVIDLILLQIKQLYVLYIPIVTLSTQDNAKNIATIEIRF